MVRVNLNTFNPPPELLDAAWDVDPEDLKDLRFIENWEHNTFSLVNGRGRVLNTFSHNDMDDPGFDVWARVISTARKIKAADTLGDIRDKYCGGRF